MVREFGPLHERFEEYILERTTDYPSVVPMIMMQRGKASFALACKDTLNHSNFSPWFDEASLWGGPGMLELDHAIVVCIGELEEDRRSGVSVRELLRREKEDGDQQP